MKKGKHDLQKAEFQFRIPGKYLRSIKQKISLLIVRQLARHLSKEMIKR